MKKLFIWGTGTIASYFISFINTGLVHIAGFIESHPSGLNTTLFGEDCPTPIFSPDILLTAEYDFIIIATEAYPEILSSCHRMGLDEKRILCTEKNEDWLKMDFGYGVPAVIIKKNLCEITSGQSVLSNIKRNQNETSGITDHDLRQYQFDYSRYKTLELAAQMIYSQHIPGEVAEVGVYRGDFAWAINKSFPDRQLYLFDTFNSFDNTEFSMDFSLQEPSSTFGIDGSRLSFVKREMFVNTNESIVMAKMPYPERVVIRKGYFPDTAKGLEDQSFAFVSLDVDLFEPTYHGLAFFYDRLCKGGYLFIHNYTDTIFPYVKDAVSRYVSENGMLNMIPLSDSGGTLVIIK